MLLKKQIERPSKKKISKPKWNPLHLKLLVILTLIGFYLRIEPVLLDDVIFSYDQGVDISYVRELVVNHKISLISRFTGLQGLFMGPLWTWILVIPYVLSGGNPSANVVFLSLIGIASIWFTYALVRRFLGETTALLTALYVAVSGPFLAAAHVVLTPVPLTVLMIFYIWFLWEIVEYDNPKYWPWLGFLVGIFFQFEIGFALFLVPATLVVLAVFGKLKKITKKPLILGLGLFILTFLPQILFDLRHDFIISKSILGFFSGKNMSLGSQNANLSERAFIRLGSFYEDFSSSVAFIGTNKLFVSLVFLPALLGWYAITNRKDVYRIRFALLLIILTLVVYAGFTFYPGPVWVWYRSGMPIVFILLVVMGWKELIKQDRKFEWLAVTIFMILAFFGTKPAKLVERALGKDEGGVVSLRNQKKALDLIFQDTAENPFDLYVYTPPVYTYVWDHNLFWYASSKYQNYPRDYGYQRAEMASNDFYLLIEPDNIPIRIDGWKGNFVKYGEPLKIWHLPGDIIIEKWKKKDAQQ